MTTSRRRRFTLSLRTSMAVVLIVGVWLGWRVRRAEIQKRAVAAIAKRVGAVTYDHEELNDQRWFRAERWAPLWLREQVGDEYFQEVVEVDFYSGEMTDD